MLKLRTLAFMLWLRSLAVDCECRADRNALAGALWRNRRFFHSVWDKGVKHIPEGGK